MIQLKPQYQTQLDNYRKLLENEQQTEDLLMEVLDGEPDVRTIVGACAWVIPANPKEAATRILTLLGKCGFLQNSEPSVLSNMAVYWLDGPFGEARLQIDFSESKTCKIVARELPPSTIIRNSTLYEVVCEE